jgi:hypothetical protein
MSKHGHMPPVLSVNHSQTGAGDQSEIPSRELLKHADVNPEGIVKGERGTFHAT